MEYDVLKRLAIHTVVTGDVPAHGLDELAQRTEAAEEATDAFNAAFDAVNRALTNGDSEALGDALGTLDGTSGEMICAYEEQGFINGFRLGVRLMQEVLTQ